MKTIAALLLGLALLAAQALHGGAFVPALAWPAYGLLFLGALAAIVTGIRSPSPPAPVPMLAGAVVAGALVLRSLGDADALLGRIDAVCVLAAALAFFVSATLPDARSRLMFLSVLLVGVVAQAAVGARQAVSQGEFSAVHWFSASLQEFYEGKFAARMRGTFLNPNQLAWFAGTMALFSTALAVWGRLSWPTRLIWGFFALFCVAMEVMTASRGGLVSLGAGFAVLLAGSVTAALSLSRRVPGGGAILGGSIAALVVAGLVAAAAISGSWAAQGRMQTFELEHDLRGLLFDDGFRAFQAAPALGHGPGSFIHLARLHRQGRHQAGDPVYAHNDWLQLLAEYGLAGFAVFALGFGIVLGGGVARFAAFVQSIRQERTQVASNTAAVLLGALAATGAMTAHSLLDFNMRIPANALLAGAVLGLLTNPDGRVLRSRRRVVFARAVNVALLAVFACGLGWAGWKFARSDYRDLTADNALASRGWRLAATEAAAGLAADPGNGRLLQTLARAQFSKATGGMSRDAYGRVVDVRIDAPRGGSGRGAESMELLARARESYEELMALSPRERSVFAEYANVLMRSGEPRQAEEAAFAAVERDPRHAYAYLALGDVYLDRGEIERARRTYFVGARLPGGTMGVAKFEAMEELLAREAAKNEEAGKQ